MGASKKKIGDLKMEMEIAKTEFDTLKPNLMRTDFDYKIRDRKWNLHLNWRDGSGPGGNDRDASFTSSTNNYTTMYFQKV